MGRLMGLDVGLRRIGVALSDEGRRIAAPHSVIEHKGWGPDIRTIGEIYRANDCEGIVCGLPRNMDGSVGFQAKEVLLFGEQLKKNGLKKSTKQRYVEKKGKKKQKGVKKSRLLRLQSRLYASWHFLL